MCEGLEEGDELEEFAVGAVEEEVLDEEPVLGLHEEGVRGVLGSRRMGAYVQDDHVLQVVVQLRQVLRQPCGHLRAVLSEHPSSGPVPRVDLVHHLVRVLAQTRSPEHQVVVLAHRLDELPRARPHHHVDLEAAPLHVHLKLAHRTVTEISNECPGNG